MSRIQPAYSDRVRYFLQHDKVGQLKIAEPIGWKADDNEFVRSKKLHGVMTQMTNNLKFVNEGRNYINTVRNTYGINANLRLVKDEKDPVTDVWTRAYDGFLDLSTWSEEDKKVSVKFNSSGLLKLIKSRESEKLELERLDTIDGKVLAPLDIKTVALKGRDIFLKSLLEVKPEDNSSSAFRMNVGNEKASLAVPTSVTYKSDELIHDVFPDSFTTTADEGDVSQLFYADNDRPKTLNLIIKMSCTITEQSISNLINGSLHVVLSKFNNSTDYNIVEPRMELTPNLINSDSVIQSQVDFETEISINLLEGESLSLQWFGTGDNVFGVLRVDFTNIIASINVDENSFFDATQSKVLLPYEMFDRMLNIITDRDNALFSNVLGRTDINYPVDGEAALIATTSGSWLRDFEEGDDLYLPFKTTWKDLRDSYLSVWNLGLGIEKIGFQERVRIEDLKYFYNRNVLIRIGSLDSNGVFQFTQVNNVKRSESETHYFSGLEFGYDKVEDYEEANGLDEFNFRNTFTTIINRLEGKYRILSKYRADAYGIEFARRKQRSLFPTDDTKYDKSNFLLDLKRGITEIFEQRLWQDDFEEEPTGIFSPETATNLRLSPFNMLLRHGWVVAAGLTKYAINFVKFASSVANSSLVTQLIGGVAYAENGNIQNNQLERARFVPEIVEFEHPVDFNLLQQVQGKTTILGEEITNWYGLIQFRNEDDQLEKGYLQNLKPNGNGKWTLLKFNNNA